MQKLELKSIVDLVHYAIRNQVVTPNSSSFHPYLRALHNIVSLKYGILCIAFATNGV
jgi:hypothetical protein